MTKVGKAVAWACLFSPLFMGCYSSTMIDPAGDERGRIYSGKIEYVVTKDSARYEFVKSPAIDNGRIVGRVASQENARVTLSLPLSELMQLSQSDAGVITRAVAKSGTKYTFKKPPVIIDNELVGEPRSIAYATSDYKEMSLPLSDVEGVSVSEFQLEKTIIFIMVPVLLYLCAPLIAIM